MKVAKVSVSIEQKVLDRLDRLVQANQFANRSQAVQQSLEEKISRLDKTRLAIECAKLDPIEEQKMADIGLKSDLEEWPEY